jgi:hypothetical protein
MTTYTTIPNSDIDADSPVTTTLMQAYRDNVAATAEGSTDAPVLSTGWHPYDMVTVGDGNDGAIYEFSVDGAVATITTPDFEDGYEYMLRFVNLGVSAPLPTMNCNLYRETDAAYTNLTVSTGMAAALGFDGLLQIYFPRVPGVYHKADWVFPLHDRTTPTSAAATGPFEVLDATVQPILRAQLDLSAGNFDQGNVYMLRRREFISG